MLALRSRWSRHITAPEVMVKLNQQQPRKKHLRFTGSPIHDWGFYALERIPKRETVVEYVDEVIRQQVAEKRERVREERHRKQLFVQNQL